MASEELATQGQAHSGAVPSLAGGLPQFQEVLLAELESIGLPTSGVLVELSERRKVLRNVEDAIAELGAEERQRSAYISKMIAAASVGLFDAALNYLWNETVRELRRRVADFDLNYFFSVAVTSPDKRKQLNSADDLPKVDDADPLRASREIGLISRITQEQLDHLRFMRNHASAAHPNQVEITGLQLAVWLETCVRNVLMLSYDLLTAETGKLLKNIKADRLDQAAIADTTAFFEDLPEDKLEALANGLFGLYTDPSKSPVIADNVRSLWPHIWPLLSREMSYGFGTRRGRFAANADVDQASASRELIDLVGGQAFLPEQTRRVEIDTALDNLMSLHNGLDNFYREEVGAKGLLELVGDSANLPDGLQTKFVYTVTKVSLGNGYGVATSALPVYEVLLGQFTPRQASLSLRSFLYPDVAAVLRSTSGRSRWRRLLEIIGPKLTSSRSRQLLAAIEEFNGTPDQMSRDSEIGRLAGKKA